MDQRLDVAPRAGYRNLPGDPVAPELAEAFWVSTPSGLCVRAYAWHEKPASAQAPALLWGHANGFNAGCYAPFLSRLAAHFQVFAFDARGQGASDAPLEAFEHHYAMDNFAMDLNAVVAAVRGRLGDGVPLHYGSHSLGGVAALLLDGRFGIRPFDSMTMFEPPVFPPPSHRFVGRARKASPLFFAWAAQRRTRFADRDELRAEAEKIVTYANFAPEMMQAYVQAAAYDSEDGGVELYCHGLAESAVYRNSPRARVFHSGARARTRTLIFSSDPALVDNGHVWAPPVLEDLVAEMANAEYRPMRGCAHLMVQEAPEACAAAVLEHALAKP
jgi:pimeloyl-ACP methyl ester carboxylesterase